MEEQQPFDEPQEGTSRKTGRMDEEGKTKKKTQGGGAHERIPFSDRQLCKIPQACQVKGVGKTKIYEAIKSGRLKSTKHGRIRLIFVSSLLGLDLTSNPKPPKDPKDIT
jgi:excisionase family DNA binding protein